MLDMNAPTYKADYSDLKAVATTLSAYSGAYAGTPDSTEGSMMPCDAAAYWNRSERQVGQISRQRTEPPLPGQAHRLAARLQREGARLFSAEPQVRATAGSKLLKRCRSRR